MKNIPARLFNGNHFSSLGLDFHILYVRTYVSNKRARVSDLRWQFKCYACSCFVIELPVLRNGRGTCEQL